ncbi:GAF domain-containing protein [Conexibacter sp. JD483]|uniref:GAF domain-containing protein n=1 Tax=unclassified Conexibacter TaxID=2627773 RepID=UPI002724721B|nr:MULTISPECIES: GAF domain-containing protein [unclassified Conexibacter]MDO8189241.1 GAF domain-containing protein [Conexibacter sp. CPCC 205706]MDO8198727.1 GAF domain-containing protein [Conexibacter sp. CPCC 205762]MDR9372114.1 GAF domain-containing protein [Conexibacter sp. JD483]
MRIIDERARRLAVAAVAHRDERAQALLGETEPDWSAASGWGGHVVRCLRPVRMAVSDGERPRMLVPLLLDGAAVGVVAAIRDVGGLPYSLREQALCERTVARVTGHREGAAGDAPESLQRLLLNRSESAIWAVDREGRTLELTPAMSELMELPIDVAERLDIAAAIDPLPASIAGSMIPEQAERGDRRLRRGDGGLLWVETCTTPLVGRQGRPIGTVTTVVDVTARKQQEVALRVRLDAAEGVTRVLASVLAGDDPDDVLRWAAHSAAEVLGVARTGIFELGRDGALTLRAGVGWPSGAVGRHRAATLGSPAGLALTAGEPVVVRDTAAMQLGVAGSGARSGCWVGIGEGRGVLAALHDEPRVYDREECRFLAGLAEAVAPCVGRAAATSAAAGVRRSADERGS